MPTTSACLTKYRPGSQSLEKLPSPQEIQKPTKLERLSLRYQFLAYCGWIRILPVSSFATLLDNLLGKAEHCLKLRSMSPNLTSTLLPKSMILMRLDSQRS